jgi:hypothetical protein
MDPGITIAVSVATSSAAAAVLTGLISNRNEVKKQLLEARRNLAGEFAGETMKALVTLRHYKPTNRRGHRNEDLHDNGQLRKERADAALEALDRLRAIRGRVWVTFPGRSTKEQREAAGSKTTADYADKVIDQLRQLETTCKRFWRECDDAKPEERSLLERTYDLAYDKERDKTWKALDTFASLASDWLEPKFRLSRFRRPIKEAASEKLAVGSGDWR